MLKRIAPVAVVALLLSTVAGSATSSLVLGRRTAGGPLEAGGDLHSQASPTPTPKPGTRCIRARVERCERAGERNTPPDVELKASERKVVVPCREGAAPESCGSGTGQQVQLQASATDSDGDSLLYSYSATGGRVRGQGAEAWWDLTGVRPGTYTATVEVDDRCGCVAFSSVRVEVESCGDCSTPPR